MKIMPWFATKWRKLNGDQRELATKIELIVSDHTSCKIECDRITGALVTERERIMAEKLYKVYRIVHDYRVNKN